LVQSAIFHPLRQNNAIISNSKYPKSKPVYFDQSASSIPGAIQITEYIEIFYNRQRKQARLGYLSPAAFMRQYYEKLFAA
jgi:putative transposase